MTQAEIAALEALEAQDEKDADRAMVGAIDDADWLQITVDTKRKSMLEQHQEIKHNEPHNRYSKRIQDSTDGCWT